MNRDRHHERNLGHGHIEVICGPMFSGKTEELIRRLRRAQIAKQRVVVFKPDSDKRYDDTNVVSHSNQRIASIPVAGVADIKRHIENLLPKVDVIGIDEAQFFDKSLGEVVEFLAEHKRRVVIAGLDQDYLGKPFGPIPHLLAIADSVSKQSAVCMVCGAPATKSQRVAKEMNADLTSQVLVGAAEKYEARCRRCYVPGIDVPRAEESHVHSEEV